MQSCGPIAQLVRAPACHAGGRRFEPVLGRHLCLGSSVGRAADWKSACRWFDSAPRHHKSWLQTLRQSVAGVAQWQSSWFVISRLWVRVQSPAPQQTIKNGQIPERPNGSDCKSDVFDFGGSNPPLPTKKVVSFWYDFFYPLRSNGISSALQGWISSITASRYCILSRFSVQKNSVMMIYTFCESD